VAVLRGRWRQALVPERVQPAPQRTLDARARPHRGSGRLALAGTGRARHRRVRVQPSGRATRPRGPIEARFALDLLAATRAAGAA
jgi:hypothetical protein